MPTLIERTTKEEQPEIFYHFELNKEENKMFFDTFLKDFFDQKLLELQGLTLGETSVSFKMKIHKKKEPTDLEKSKIW